jgi:hypothetical protein
MLILEKFLVGRGDGSISTSIFIKFYKRQGEPKEGGAFALYIETKSIFFF